MHDLFRYVLASLVVLAPSSAPAVELGRNDARYTLDLTLPHGASFVPDGIDRKFQIGSIEGNLRLIQDAHASCDPLTAERSSNWRKHGFTGVAALDNGPRECSVALENPLTGKRTSSFYVWLDTCSCFSALHFYYAGEDRPEYLSVVQPILDSLRANNRSLNEPTQVAAASAEPVRVRDDTSLNARTGPGTEHAVVRKLAPGTELERHEVVGDWSRVQLDDGTEAWVASDYLDDGSLEFSSSSDDSFTDRFPLTHQPTYGEAHRQAQEAIAESEWLDSSLASAALLELQGEAAKLSARPESPPSALAVLEAERHRINLDVDPTTDKQSSEFGRIAGLLRPHLEDPAAAEQFAALAVRMANSITDYHWEDGVPPDRKNAAAGLGAEALDAYRLVFGNTPPLGVLYRTLLPVLADDAERQARAYLDYAEKRQDSTEQLDAMIWLATVLGRSGPSVESRQLLISARRDVQALLDREIDGSGSLTPPSALPIVVKMGTWLERLQEALKQQNELDQYIQVGDLRFQWALATKGFLVSGELVNEDAWVFDFASALRTQDPRLYRLVLEYYGEAVDAKPFDDGSRVLAALAEAAFVRLYDSDIEESRAYLLDGLHLARDSTTRGSQAELYFINALASLELDYGSVTLGEDYGLEALKFLSAENQEKSGERASILKMLARIAILKRRGHQLGRYLSEVKSSEGLEDGSSYLSLAADVIATGQCDGCDPQVVETMTRDLRSYLAHSLTLEEPYFGENLSWMLATSQEDMSAELRAAALQHGLARYDGALALAAHRMGIKDRVLPEPVRAIIGLYFARYDSLQVCGDFKELEEAEADEPQSTTTTHLDFLAVLTSGSGERERAFERFAAVAGSICNPETQNQGAVSITGVFEDGADLAVAIGDEELELWFLLRLIDNLQSDTEELRLSIADQLLHAHARVAALSGSDTTSVRTHLAAADGLVAEKLRREWRIGSDRIASALRGLRPALRSLAGTHLDLVAAEGEAAAASDLDAALKAVQLAQFSDAGLALVAADRRRLETDEELAKLVGERDESERELRRMEDFRRRYYGTVDPPDYVRARQEISARLADIDGQLAESGSLSNVEIIASAELRALIGPGEAVLVPYLAEEGHAFLIAASADKLVVRETGPADFAQLARRLRCGSDAFGCIAAPGTRGAITKSRGDHGFDFEAARLLYDQLIRPVADVIGGRDIIVVPEGPLGTIPFELLASGPVPPRREGIEAFKSAPWLVRDRAVTVLPALSNLKSLRVGLAQLRPAAKPFAGFGDPVIGAANAIACPDLPGQGTQIAMRGAVPPSVATQALFRSGSSLGDVAIADVNAIRSLARLPDTRCELETMAAHAGATRGDLFLGDDATETALKELSTGGRLKDYRVLAFSTHGLLAGEAGASEPALVMTPPEVGSVADDGLLTASEIAGLDLNADFVILSACNTAGADGPQSEALSGLARAFFTAGARSVLVSHWPVYSDAAVRLTTTAFAELEQDPDIGRAEAMRRSMLRVLDEASDLRTAHPSYWAPFSLAGDGAGRRAGPSTVP